MTPFGIGLAVALLASAGYGEPPAQETYHHGVIIRFEGMINALRAQYLFRKLDEARERGADLVVIEIDSPGGELEASEDIARRLDGIQWAHVVAFVPRQALSGAAIFALGADEILMAPRAAFGDAGPIFLDEDFLFRHAPEKVRTHLARLVRDLAEAHGRPPSLAEAMIDYQLVVHKARNTKTGEEAYFSRPELEAREDADDWELLQPVLETRKGHFLEVNGQRAVELGLAEGLAENRAAVARRFGFQEPLEVLDWNRVDTAVLILNHPLVTGLLLVAGLIALYLEFASPGIGIGGLVALTCFGLFFWSRFLGGTAEWLEVVLFLLGLVFMGIEVFVMPGFGIWGVTGLLLWLVSLVLVSEPFLIPQTREQLTGLGNSAAIVVLSLGVSFVGIILMTAYIGKIPVLNRLALAPPEPLLGDRSERVAAEPSAPVQPGDRGVADGPLRPAGKARFGDQYLDVFSDGRFIEDGTPVEVLEIRGSHIVVRAANDQPNQA